jgi:hypothetical protein
MTTFLFSYRMPTGYAPGRPDALAAWRSFFEGIGGDLLDMGNPVFESAAVGNCGPDTTLGGYSLVRADNLDDAVALAGASPGMTEGGGVEVGVITGLGGASQ